MLVREKPVLSSVVLRSLIDSCTVATAEGLGGLYSWRDCFKPGLALRNHFGPRAIGRGLRTFLWATPSLAGTFEARSEGQQRGIERDLTEFVHTHRGIRGCPLSRSTDSKIYRRSILCELLLVPTIHHRLVRGRIEGYLIA